MGDEEVEYRVLEEHRYCLDQTVVWLMKRGRSIQFRIFIGIDHGFPRLGQYAGLEISY